MGIAIITKLHLGQCKLDEGQKQSFQYAIWKISTKHDTITEVVIYHPPCSTQQSVTNAIFLEEITKWLTDVLTNHNNITLEGDFNLHVNDGNNKDASIFIDTKEAMGLQQYIMYPTHKSDNTLDLVFTELMTQIHIDYWINDTNSYRQPVFWHISVRSLHCWFQNYNPKRWAYSKDNQVQKTQKVLFQKKWWRTQDAMQDRIQDENQTHLINSFESVLKDALDKHAPAITKILMTRKSNPWFTVEVRSQKRLLRKMEWTYHRSKQM